MNDEHNGGNKKMAAVVTGCAEKRVTSRRNPTRTTAHRLTITRFIIIDEKIPGLWSATDRTRCRKLEATPTTVTWRRR